MDPKLHQAIARHTSKNYGVISRARALHIGLSLRQINLRVARGEWEVLAPGVYRVAAAPVSPRTPLVVELTASGGLAATRSAGELLGLQSEVPATPEILIDVDSRYTGPALVRRTTMLGPADHTRRGGLPTTSVARTLFDLATVLSEFELEGVMNKAVSERKVTRAQLVDRFDALAGRGRRGTVAMRKVLERMPANQPALAGHLELRILDVLRTHGVRLPERQVNVRIDGASYYLDFAYVAEKVFLEGDGFGVHALRTVFESDRVRQNALVRAGWLPLRYTDRMLRRRPAAIADEIRAVLRSAAA
jgi:very-short-patch-repair endonuclease